MQVHYLPSHVPGDGANIAHDMLCCQRTYGPTPMLSANLDVGLKALDAGLHLLMEKPMTTDVVEARRLLDAPEVEPVGLGARDSLRLEAGLCLYGNDLTPDITPIEAGLAWTISKRRRESGGFPGDAIIKAQIADGPARRRVGIKPEGRAPARAHTAVLGDGDVIG